MNAIYEYYMKKILLDVLNVPYFLLLFPMRAKLPCYAVIWDKDNVLDRFI